VVQTIGVPVTLRPGNASVRLVNSLIDHCPIVIFCQITVDGINHFASAVSLSDLFEGFLIAALCGVEVSIYTFSSS